jgi:DNA (cytosine-5)-methyltransferase 1
MAHDRKVFEGVPYRPRARWSFRFADLFAGIGGFRIGLQRVGGRAVFSSEWDSAARTAYARNFGDVPFGDIRMFTRGSSGFRRHATISNQIPDVDIISGGFPCQPFSLAGVTSRRHHRLRVGLDCEEQGTLFDDIMAIVRAKRTVTAGPQVLFFENVRNLLHHDRGRTFSTIESKVRDAGYELYWSIVDSQSRVPQRRKRIYMVCIRDDIARANGEFEFPRFEVPDPELPLRDALDALIDVSEYQISSRLWTSHRRRSRRHVQRGNGFVIHEADLDKPANTLVARYYKDGKDCLVPVGRRRNPRMLTPRECARLQGFDPETFVFPGSRTTSYRLFGNSVTVPVVEEIARKIIRYLF